MSGLSANKKILISVSAFILIIAAIVGVLLILGGNSGKKPGPENTEENTVIYTYKNDEPDTEQPEEPVSYTQPSTSPAMNTNNSDHSEQIRLIEAYISGNYYMSAVIDADGSPMNMDMSVRGSDFQTTVDIEGKTMTIIYMNNSIYLVDEDSKKYVEFSQALLAMSGIDISELSEITAELDLSNYDFKSVDLTEAKIDGYSADCYIYRTADTSIYFYFIGSELRRIDYGDADGNTGITIDINQFSPTYPANVFSLSGLTKSTLFDFFGTSFE